MKVDSILQKVRALRNLSAQASTVEEAATAAAQADALLQKYRLSEADVGNASAEVESVTEGEEPLWVGRVQLDKPTARLCAVLAEHYGCAVISHRHMLGGRTLSVSLRIAGRASDVEIVRYMFAWLSAEIARLAKSEPAPTRGSFRQGAVTGIRYSLASSVEVAKTEHASANGSGAAMVLASRVDEAKEWFRADSAKDGRTIGNVPAGKVVDRGAYLRGREAGEGIGLNDRALSSGVRALPSGR